MNSSDIVSFPSGNSQQTVSRAFYPDLTTTSYLSEGELLGLVIFLVSFGIIGFLENLVVIFSVVLCDGYLVAPSNIFLLSLACADLLVCGVSTPMLIYNSYHWIFDIFITASKLIVVATSGSIFLLTLNRLISILWPLKYHHIMTIERALWLVALIWILASMVVVAAVISVVCGIRWLYHITRYFLSFYILATSLMYIYMYILARKHRRLIRQQRYAVTGQTEGAIQEFRALWTLLIVAGTCVACWLPMTIAFFLTSRRNDPAKFYRIFSFTGPLILVNAALDPMIYYYRNRGFRLSVRKLVKELRDYVMNVMS